MAQKMTGALVFDERTDRYDIRFDLASYYGGLHCGDCFDVFTRGKWKPTRIEMNMAQIIFLLTVLAMFLIAGSMDCGEISFGAAMAASAVNFIIMAWSGFSSGLLATSDKK